MSIEADGQPTKFELVIIWTAKALGINISQSLLERGGTVIEYYCSVCLPRAGCACGGYLHAEQECVLPGAPNR